MGKQFQSKRTENDMLSLAPVLVRLGREEYSLPVPSNRKAAEWREKLYAALGPLVASFDFGDIDVSADRETVSAMMSQKMSQELVQFPQKLLELLLDFAPDVLPRDKVMDEASDEQICLAFAAVSEVGYPFFFHLWATKRALSTAPERPPTMETERQTLQ